MKEEEIKKFREYFDKVIAFPEGEEKEISYKDQLRIHKKFNSKKNPQFKLVWEYLINNINECPIGKKKICKDLKVLKGTLDIYLCELNRYIKTQSIRWFHSPGHKGFIQTAGFSPIDDVRVLKGRTKRTISEVTRTGQTRHIVKIKEEMKSLEEKKQRNKEILLKIYT